MRKVSRSRYFIWVLNKPISGSFMPHSLLAKANAIILTSRVSHRFSNASREVCRKYPTLSYFLTRDFVAYDDTLFKTCPYAKTKFPADVQKIPVWGV